MAAREGWQRQDGGRPAEPSGGPEPPEDPEEQRAPNLGSDEQRDEDEAEVPWPEQPETD